MYLLINLIGCQPVRNMVFHGAGNYLEVIFDRIVSRGLPVKCVYDSRKKLNPYIKELIDAYGIQTFDISADSIQNIVRKSKCEVFLNSKTSKGFCMLQDIDIVATQHDLRQLELPRDPFIWRYREVTILQLVKHLVRKFYPRIAYLRNGTCVDYSKQNYRLHLVTVSDHSKAMIRYFYPDQNDDCIPVFYSPSTAKYDISDTKYKEKFFLLVSANRCEKNNLRAIMALDRLFSKKFLAGYCVRVTGAKDSSAFRYKIKNKDRFHFMGYVSNEELSQLQHDCYCFIFPSLNEGFGYPPVEVMRYGKPVLASAISSIPEICGDAALYFFPFSIDEIAGRILTITREDIYHEYACRSLKRYKEITERQKADLEGFIDYIYNGTFRKNL